MFSLPGKFSKTGGEEMSKNYNIVFCYNPAYVSDEVVEAAKKELPKGFNLVSIERDTPPKKKLDIYKKADFLMEFSADPTPEEFEALKKVKFIQVLSAGYNKFDMKTANKMKIQVANNHGNCVAVAEFTILLILTLLRKLPVHYLSTKNGKWLEHSLMLEQGEFAGRTLGLVGLGYVGQEVAKRAKGFDVSILYYDIRRLKSSDEKKLGLQFAPLNDLLKKSDVVSLHLALTPQSKGIIGKKEFKIMKSTAFLINTARGGVVDSKELYNALYNRKIAGAALDVFVQEPPDPNDPLFLLDNVIVTPHMAGGTIDTWSRRLRIAFENFQRVVENKPARFVVNPNFGS
jgi:phosphoglycerate dehydrogenase-like enzyme